MNRFVFGGCLVVFFGCGARSETFFAPEGVAGTYGSGGTSAAAGRSFGGANNTAGWFNNLGGRNNTGGGTSVGGWSNNAAGGPSVGGWFGVGGSTPVAGWTGTGGSSFGGFNGVAGWIGTGGTPGIVEQACRILASTPCQQCMCTSCAPQIVECIGNVGCALILACAQQTGCQGLNCYSPQACKSVIDQYGGLTGGAMQDVISLYTCSLTSQSSCGACN